MKIAVVIHAPDQTRLVCQVLAAAGHACHVHSSGAEFFDFLRQGSADLLVMDWQLQDMPALELVRALHDSSPSLPILLLAEHADEDEIVAALAAGASDYQVKPLRRRELAMRVRILLKRSYPEQETAGTVRFGRYAFETGSARLAVDGTSVELTRKEFTLALLFFRNLGRPLSRAYIQENVWSREAELPSRTLDTHVSRVRHKLGLQPENGFRLVPVYSYGYRLEQLAV